MTKNSRRFTQKLPKSILSERAIVVPNIGFDFGNRDYCKKKSLKESDVFEEAGRCLRIFSYSNIGHLSPPISWEVGLKLPWCE